MLCSKRSRTWWASSRMPTVAPCPRNSSGIAVALQPAVTNKFSKMRWKVIFGYFSIEIQHVLVIRDICSQKEYNGAPYNPAITFVVCVRNSHSKLFAKNASDRVGEGQNVPAGTVVTGYGGSPDRNVLYHNRLVCDYFLTYFIIWVLLFVSKLQKASISTCAVTLVSAQSTRPSTRFFMTIITWLCRMSPPWPMLSQWTPSDANEGTLQLFFIVISLKLFSRKKNGPRCWKTNIFQHFWARACSIGFSSCRARHGPLERRPGQARGGPWWPRSSGVSGHWWKQDQDALPIYQRKFLHLKIFVPFKPRATVNLCYLPSHLLPYAAFFLAVFRSVIRSV